MTDVDVVWEDPPEPEGREQGGWRGQRLAWIEALRANPGRWALYPFTTDNRRGPDNASYRLRHEAGLEAVVRRVDGERRVYARYVPPAGTP